MKIAIHQNNKIFSHYTSWAYQWIQYCEINNFQYEIVDCYDTKVINQLIKFDILLWHFFGNVIQDMNFARSILFVSKRMGLQVFPDFNESWHFDDKISETYLLQSIDAPIPKSWMFFTKEDLKNWMKKNSQYPLIAKLKNGTGSGNVKLLNNPKALLRYGEKMFGRGFSPSSKIFFKAKSKLDSSKNLEDITNRISKIPQFFQTWKRSKQLPNEKGYVYLQEFIPNANYDLKVIVVGDKLSFVCRSVRKNDFRASGGGDLFYDKSLLTKEIRDIAFSTSDKLGFQCMGYDFVVNEEEKAAKIVEMSYGFDHKVLMGSGGYWDREDNWYDEPLNAPVEILKNIILKFN